MNYDFIVFESYHLATHHIYDMILIARMLKSQGKTVAIFDIYHEIPENSRENIPVIHWTSKCGVLMINGDSESIAYLKQE